MGTVTLLLILSVYFLPSFLAGRKKKNRAPIYVINLFLGWTLVGWVVALAWALSDDK